MDAQVLCLDVGYQPVSKIPWETAIVHVLDHIAEVVDEYPDLRINTPNWSSPMPSVIRLLKPIKKKRAVKFSRSNIYVRDGMKCGYCGRRLGRGEMTYDHVIPRRLGGKTSWENVISSCIPCNQRKGGRTPEEAGMRLLSIPVKPKKLPDVPGFSMTYNKGMPESWRAYMRDAVYWTGTLDEE